MRTLPKYSCDEIDHFAKDCKKQDREDRGKEKKFGSLRKRNQNVSSSKKRTEVRLEGQASTNEKV